jgi:hypothetical protein
MEDDSKRSRWKQNHESSRNLSYPYRFITRLFCWSIPSEDRFHRPHHVFGLSSHIFRENGLFKMECWTKSDGQHRIALDNLAIPWKSLKI